MDTIRKIDNKLRHFPRPYLTDAELTILLGGTSDSRYGKVKRLLAQGRLLHIRRGLYCLTGDFGHSQKVHPYELAQHIYGPSYISLESALSFHQLIPEMTFTVTSVVVKRSKNFMTPLGKFSYLHLPEKNFYLGVDLIHKIAQEIALMTLSRAGFFRIAAFQGGTCLRILYGLQRFSEDLDFVLLNPDQTFDWNVYVENMREEFEAYGYTLRVIIKARLEKAIQSAFLKADSQGGILVLEDNRTNWRGIWARLKINDQPAAACLYHR